MEEFNQEKLDACVGIKNGLLMSLPFWLLFMYWLVWEGLGSMKIICGTHYDDQVIQDILKNSELISLTNGDLLYPNGYSLVSVDQQTHYSLMQVFSQIRYVLDKKQQVLYIKNIKTNQLEKKNSTDSKSGMNQWSRMNL